MAGDADFGRVGWLTTREMEDRAWRVERFRELGFDRDRRQQLAEVGADWHEAQAMLLRGASHQDVYAILM